jgi:hypothetical protein
MKSNFIMKPATLAVAALFAAPAFAQEVDVEVWNRHYGLVAYLNATAVLKARVDAVANLVAVRGTVNVSGNIGVDGESATMVDTKQESVLNTGINTVVDNAATVDGGALNGATGNIGVNVAAGDNNAQTNDGALSAVDASFVFADAQSFGYQKSAVNQTTNNLVNNNAVLNGALVGATGNVGVNIAAGSNNVQANALAISTGFGTQLAKAGSYTNQMAAGNTTSNLGTTRLETGTLISMNLQGRYAGIVDQFGDQYPDTWDGATHPGGSQTGHIDLDTAVQGASERPQPSSLSIFNPSTRSIGGSLSFNEAGELQLSGSFSQVNFVRAPHLNTASLGGAALANAQGNVGVNIAAGSGNLQRNSHAVAVGLGRPGNGGGGGGGGGGGETLR